MKLVVTTTIRFIKQPERLSASFGLIAVVSAEFKGPFSAPTGTLPPHDIEKLASKNGWKVTSALR